MRCAPEDRRSDRDRTGGRRRRASRWRSRISASGGRWRRSSSFARRRSCRCTRPRGRHRRAVRALSCDVPRVGLYSAVRSLMTPSPNRTAYAAWLIVCVLWGTTYLAIAIALETLPPLFLAGFRYILAGGLMVAVLKARGETMPAPGAWGRLAVLGILLLGFGNGGLVWAEQTIPSGFAALLVAMTPFWMVGIDSLMTGAERLTRLRILGLVIGFAGVLMLVWPEIAAGGGRGFLQGVIAAEIACVGWALGSSYARRRKPEE